MTALPREMTAIAITAPGRPEVLKPQQIAVPVPKDDELLIEV